MIFLLILCIAASAAPAMQVDVKSLAKEVNNDMRAVEKMTDNNAAVQKLAEVRKKIDQMRAIDADYFEIKVIETKYKRLVSIYGVSESALPAAKPASSSAAATSSGKAPAANGDKDRALKDWEAIVALYRDFKPRLEEVIPTYVKNVIYSDDNVDDVLAKIAALRKEAPAVKAQLVAFGQRYGTEREVIDAKIYALTPKDFSLSSSDPRNERPSESPGRAFEVLSSGLVNLEDAPKLEARHILTQVLQSLDSIESFVMDTERDKRYAQAEARVALALRFDPDDADAKEWAQKLKVMRVKSKVEIEKALDAARFPGQVASFGGPGTVSGLAAAALKFFKEQGGNETTVAVSIAGEWMVAKRNIFSEPIQWGLPIWAVSYHNETPDVARVFKMTIVTGEGLGIAKAPPFTAVWVGDSYRMRTKNIK